MQQNATAAGGPTRAMMGSLQISPGPWLVLRGPFRGLAAEREGGRGTDGAGEAYSAPQTSS